MNNKEKGELTLIVVGLVIAALSVAYFSAFDFEKKETTWNGYRHDIVKGS